MINLRCSYRNEERGPSVTAQHSKNIEMSLKRLDSSNQHVAQKKVYKKKSE